MANVTYTPTDGEDAQRMCTVFGMTFAPGKPEEVDDASPFLAKLRNNGQFTVEDDGPKGRASKAA
jgi:hypothetical protein